MTAALWRRLAEIAEECAAGAHRQFPERTWEKFTAKLREEAERVEAAAARAVTCPWCNQRPATLVTRGRNTECGLCGAVMHTLD